MDNIAEKLFERNGKKYNFHKAAEEFLELALVLNQKLLKPTKVNEQQIIDEIGDCELRLKVLKKYFDSKKIKKRILYKTKKFNSYIENNTYDKI